MSRGNRTRVKEFRKRTVACMEDRKERERQEDKKEDIVVTERQEWESLNERARTRARARERERERRREVVGGSGPYREAGTTLASTILSAKDIHNHLVPLALSRGTRVVVTRRPLLDIRSTKGGSSLLSLVEEREREREGNRPTSEKDLSMSSLLPSFLRHALFQTPSTSYYFFQFPLTLGRTSGILRALSKRTHGRRSEVPFILRGRDGSAQIKNGDFASFRASLLFDPVLFVNRCFCINRNLSPPKTKPP